MKHILTLLTALPVSPLNRVKPTMSHPIRIGLLGHAVMLCLASP